jgi:hypothetical protein
MSVLQFIVSMSVPAAITVYTIHFSIWLWRRRERLAAVGGGILGAVCGLGSLAYFMMKLLA